MQHSELEHISSDPTVRLFFHGKRVYLLGLLNDPDPVSQGFQSTLNMKYLCAREGSLPIFDRKLPCR